MPYNHPKVVSFYPLKHKNQIRMRMFLFTSQSCSVFFLGVSINLLGWRFMRWNVRSRSKRLNWSVNPERLKWEKSLCLFKSRRWDIINLSTHRVSGNWKERKIYSLNIFTTELLDKFKAKAFFLLLSYTVSMKKVSISDITFTRRLSSPHGFHFHSRAYKKQR